MVVSLTIIEPHADDAFLSLGAHIENWIKAGEKVSIVTVFSATRKRARDAETYANAVGADWYGLGLEEGEHLTSINLDVFEDSTVIGPLGISHNEHTSVAGCLPSGALRYLDSPYHITQKNSEEVSNALYARAVYSFLKPSARKWRHIPLFKDQAKFFHYNPPEKLRECIELIVGPRIP